MRLHILHPLSLKATPTLISWRSHSLPRQALARRSPSKHSVITAFHLDVFIKETVTSLYSPLCLNKLSHLLHVTFSGWLFNPSMSIFYVMQFHPISLKENGLLRYP